MENPALVLAYDVGTTGNKTCLYRIGATLELVDSCLVEYPLLLTPDGGAEQRVDDWWNAVCSSTRTLIQRTSLNPRDIRGIAFCCQMQGSILVDREGSALRNPMIYMDSRAVKQIEDHLYHGVFRIEKINALKLLKSLWITGGIAATPKDPLWKYHWVRENEPEVFNRVYKWLDVKDYLILRATGCYGMTRDSAHITFVYDTRKGKEGWHKGLCRTYGVDMDHLPKVVASTDVVGSLSDKAALEMGLAAGTPVFGGGGDVTLTTIGSGALDLYDTHIYVGTSGWVVSNVDKRRVDISNFIASVSGAIPGRYNYVAEQETSGACLQWVRDHLAMDDIGIYLNAHRQDGRDDVSKLYELLNQAVKETEPGAGGLIFTPWLHGNRAPKEDPYARGVFFNIGMNTGKRRMIRAVLEGVAFHKRWMLEAVEKTFPVGDRVRFVGGGAKSEIWCQIMADVTGKIVETVQNPQDIGTAGAAVVCGVGLGVLPSFDSAKKLIPSNRYYSPREEYKPVYDRLFGHFKTIYRQNRKLFREMNAHRTD